MKVVRPDFQRGVHCADAFWYNIYSACNLESKIPQW